MFLYNKKQKQIKTKSKLEMSSSVRLSSTALNFRDTESNSLMKLTATAGTATLWSDATDGRVTLTNLAMPTAASDAATKSYVDSLSAGLAMKGSVAYITHGEIFGGASDYKFNADTQTFTAKGEVAWEALTSDQIDITPDENGDERTIADARAANYFDSHTDFVARNLEYYHETTLGVTGTATENRGARRDWPTRILVNGETNARLNGIYWIKSLGDENTPFELQRTSNFDSLPTELGEIKPGAFCFVADGLAYASKGMVLVQDAEEPVEGGFNCSKTGSDGNLIRFEGFSSKGNLESGKNIVVDGERIATVDDPQFRTAEIGSVTISTNEITSALDQKVVFQSTEVQCTENITSDKKMIGSQGFAAGGTLAAPKFNVTNEGTVDTQALDVRGVAATLHGANLLVKDDDNTTKMDVDAATGNTTVKGTLKVHDDTKLGVKDGTGKPLVDVVPLGFEPDNLPTLRLYGLTQVVKADDTPLFSVAMNSGNLTIAGETEQAGNFYVKQDQEVQASITADKGNMMVKGGITAVNSKFKVGDETDANNIMTVNSNKRVLLNNSTGTNILRAHLGTNPHLSLMADSNFYVNNSTGEEGITTFEVLGATGKTTMKGDLVVGEKFTVTAGEGDVNIDGSATVHANMTVDTGNLTVMNGKLEGAGGKFVVHEAAAAAISTFKGDGFTKWNSGSGTAEGDMVTIEGSTGNVDLNKGAKLVLKNENNEDRVHLEGKTGNVKIFAGMLSVNDNVTMSASDGSTMVGGTLSLKGDMKVTNSGTEMCSIDHASGTVTSSGDLVCTGGASFASTAVTVSATGALKTTSTLEVDDVTTLNNDLTVVKHTLTKSLTVTEDFSAREGKLKVNDTFLGEFTHKNQTLVLKESDQLGACVELCTGDTSEEAATKVAPKITLKKGGVLGVHDADGGVFTQVNGTERSVALGGVNGGMLRMNGGFEGAVQTKAQINMATGGIKTQGGLAVYPGIWKVDGTNGGVDSTFSVASTGNTDIEGTLDVKLATTVTEGDLSVSQGSLIVGSRFESTSSHLGKFKGDLPLEVHSSTGGKNWAVAGDTGSQSLFNGAMLTFHNGSSDSNPSASINGSSGDISTSTTLHAGDGKFSVKTDGNVETEGTLNVHKSSTLQGAVTALDTLSVKEMASEIHKFSVAPGTLGRFVGAHGTEESFKIEQLNSSDVPTTRFSVSSSNGNTVVHGGQIQVKTQQGVSAYVVHPTNGTKLTSTDTTSALVIEKAPNEPVFTVNAASGAITHTGNLTSTGTAIVEGSLEVKGDANRKLKLNKSDSDVALSLGSDTGVAQIGSSTVPKFSVECSSGAVQTCGDIALQDHLGQSANTLATIQASTGNITTLGSYSGTGDIVLKNADDTEDDPARVTLTASSGNITTQGVIDVCSGKYRITTTGTTWQEGNLELGAGNVAKVRMESSNGNITSNGGNLIVKDSGGTIEKFKVDASSGSTVVSGDTTCKANLMVGEGPSGQGPAFKVEPDGDTKLSGGNFSIDDPGGIEKFSVSASNGNVTTKGDLEVTGDIVGSTNANFGQTCQASSFVALSDERLKKDLKVIKGPEALEMVSKLEGHKYHWINKAKYGDGEAVGFIAQKAEKVHPSLVKVDSDDGMYRMNYGIVSALLAPAVTELNKQIQELKAEVASLKAEKAATAAATEAPAEAPAEAPGVVPV